MLTRAIAIYATMYQNQLHKIKVPNAISWSVRRSLPKSSGYKKCDRPQHSGYQRCDHLGRNLGTWVRSLVKKSSTQTAIAFDRIWISKVRSLYGKS
ncbi:hypothetical protein [Nostoc sp. FACHB-145]|uniref:hypothetical protein n=1 Tax=Nostoc sp. FACHB-145 TaxID=2692836 RepID=UPI0016884D27|nr:hypothetical protein [Nostoc sp. FACHB-145]MBD2471996.1 hypothetical protein [Nostoc sp. FACHB-145]